MQSPLDKFKPAAPRAIKKQAKKQAKGSKRAPNGKARVYIYERPGDYTKQKYEPEEVIPKKKKKKKYRVKVKLLSNARIEQPKRGRGVQVRWTYPF